jgi:hypothetical protein
VSGLLGRRHVQAAACRTSFTNRVATSSQTSKLSRPPRLTIQPTLQRPFGVQLWRASSSRSGKAKQRPEPTQTRASAFAIYARASTEDQAERETIQSQLGFLREFVNLHGPPVAGEYVDDGISGTVPLAERPEGQRLAVDAEASRFGVVLDYGIDRLGRSLRSLLNAHDTLSDCGVAIRSATERFDTSSPIGRSCSSCSHHSPSSRSRPSVSEHHAAAIVSTRTASGLVARSPTDTTWTTKAI